MRTGDLTLLFGLGPDALANMIELMREDYVILEKELGRSTKRPRIE